MNKKMSFGAEIVQMLLPHRRPFLMVDRILDFKSGKKPSLRAQRHLSINEPVFAGHFPGLALYPGAMTLEGLAQSAHLLMTLHHLQNHFSESSAFTGELMDALHNIEMGYRFHPGYDAQQAKDFLAAFEEASMLRFAVVGAVKAKFLKPVFAGEVLEYSVHLQRELDHLIHFETEAEVNGTLVAKASLSASQIHSEMPAYWRKDL